MSGGVAIVKTRLIPACRDQPWRPAEKVAMSGQVPSQIIGVLSDTHGVAVHTARAGELFVRHGVGRVFHCGDIGGEAVVDALAHLDVTYVLGNMDRDEEALSRYIRALGQTVGTPYACCEVAGRRIAAIHGDDWGALCELIQSQRFDVVLHGHTHRVRDECMGPTRVVCPGALHGPDRPTVAVVQLNGPTGPAPRFLEL